MSVWLWRSIGVGETEAKRAVCWCVLESVRRGGISWFWVLNPKECKGFSRNRDALTCSCPHVWSSSCAVDLMESSHLQQACSAADLIARRKSNKTRRFQPCCLFPIAHAISLARNFWCPSSVSELLNKCKKSPNFDWSEFLGGNKIKPSRKPRHCWHCPAECASSGRAWALFMAKQQQWATVFIVSLLRFTALWILKIVGSPLHTVVSCIRCYFLPLTSSCCHLSVFKGYYQSVPPRAPMLPQPHTYELMLLLRFCKHQTWLNFPEQLLLSLSWCVLWSCKRVCEFGILSFIFQLY